MTKDRRHTLSNIHLEKKRKDGEGERYELQQEDDHNSNAPIFSFPTDTIIPIANISQSHSSSLSPSPSTSISSNPKKIIEIKSQISSIGKSLNSNIKNAMERGDSIGDLYQKTFTLEQQSATFRRKSIAAKEAIIKREREYGWSVKIGVLLVLLLVVFGVMQMFKEWFIRILERRMAIDD